jgi:hypothetical protein
VRREALVDGLRVRELNRVIAALEQVDALPVAFKGAALAHTHYVESWHRTRIDADVLIAPASRARAFDALRELGYERLPFVSGDLVMYQVPCVWTDDFGIEHAVDLHWQVSNRQVVAHVLTHSELAARATTVSALGSVMRVPSPVDALILACVHRAAHHDDAESLIWLYDIHLIAERLNSHEWETLVHRASDRGVAALCARGLQLSSRRFDTRMSLEVIAGLRPGRGRRRETSALFLRKDLRPFDRLVGDLRALGLRDAAHLIREHLFPSREYINTKYAFRSRALLPAYYAFRAVAGASKWFRRAD